MLSKDGFFTEEQDKWLIENYPIFSRKECVIRFNEKFKTNRNENSISDRAIKRLKIKRLGNSGRYGNREKEELPIGTVRENQVGTYIKIKSCKGCNITGYTRPYWIPLQEKVYIDKYGKIPDDYMVCFLDNDRHNFELDNLYAINRKISARMAQNNWWTTNKINTLTAIKWCELYYALKNKTER